MLLGVVASDSSTRNIGSLSPGKASVPVFSNSITRASEPDHADLASFDSRGLLPPATKWPFLGRRGGHKACFFVLATIGEMYFFGSLEIAARASTSIMSEVMRAQFVKSEHFGEVA